MLPTQEASLVSHLPAELRARMVGRSWQPDPRCPPLDSLRLVTVWHRTFSGGEGQGALVLAGEVAEEVASIFQALHQLAFPIARIEPVDAFGGDDDASMAANNTSAFNFRVVAGTSQLSHHAYGLAIDLNPVQNPMLVGPGIFPPAGAAYLDRSQLRPGMITDQVVALFAGHGWHWGGHWESPLDYHHFYKPRPDRQR